MPPDRTRPAKAGIIEAGQATSMEQVMKQTILPATARSDAWQGGTGAEDRDGGHLAAPSASTLGDAQNEQRAAQADPKASRRLGN